MPSPQTLTREEVTTLISYAQRAVPRHNPIRAQIRNHAILVTLLETGLRVDELCRLQIGDLLFQGSPVRTLIVREEIAKRHKAREIPVSPLLSRTLLDCANRLWTDHRFSPQTYCWYYVDPARHISTRSVEHIIRSLATAALGRPVHPHMLRHTFATQLMKVAPTRVVQELLGHANLSSTQIYTHPDADDRAAAIAAKDAQTNGATP